MRLRSRETERSPLYRFTGDKDYGPNTPDNRLGIVDLRDFSFAGHMDLGLYKGPHAMMTDRDGKIWVTVDPNRCVLIIDPDSREIERTTHLEVPGYFLAASPDGYTVYFSAKEYPVVVVDVASKQVTGRISVPVGGQAAGYLRMAQSSVSGIFTGLCFMSSIATAVNYWKRFRLPACRAGRSTAPTGNL